jgi:hypothetical protein
MLVFTGVDGIGATMEFVVFGLTLVGVALFHRRALTVAFAGLVLTIFVRVISAPARIDAAYALGVTRTFCIGHLRSANDPLTDSWGCAEMHCARRSHSMPSILGDAMMSAALSSASGQQ